MKIVVYSGSFNPFHIGHFRIIQTLSSREDIDLVIVIVSPKNPSKPESYYVQSAEERLEAVKDRCKDLPKVLVSDLEFHREPPCYTIDTLREIQSIYPGVTILYSCGADTLEKIGRWRSGKLYWSEFGILVSPRAGYNLDSIILGIKKKDENAKIEVLDIPENRDIPISSTLIREEKIKSDSL